MISALLVFGAVVLTLLDSIHVHTGTLVYARPFAYGSAWWVPLQMGLACALGGTVYVRAYARLGERRVAPWPKVGLALLTFALVYALTGLLPATTTTKAVVLTVAAVAMHADLGGGGARAGLMVVGALVGSFAEAVHPGFRYVAPDVFGVPLWLPSLYACATGSIGELARRLWWGRGSPSPRKAWLSGGS